ncbi:NEP1-interacting protein-like 1 [Ipomoea triloba]|uniref:NEP1-interacting protein-like 1 n=1 Tax=Ipomoea triloba TaxID=35885 RepID=UPI00125E2F0B|nr:NEP1-interacting protein-like 1 [Ipomoea triloba]
MSSDQISSSHSILTGKLLRMKTRLFSRIEGLVLRSRDCLFSWVSADMLASASAILFMLFKKTVWSLSMCVLALGGATVGIVTGALKGQTTETGLLRGAAVGSVAGAITAVQLLELMINGESFSKVALVCSLVDGKVFMEWVSPAVLKAYQWQVGTVDTSLREISDIFDTNQSRGLSNDTIQKLPKYRFQHSAKMCRNFEDITCAICLQDFDGGEYVRMLPNCRHSFHLPCIDEWLVRHGNCPVCRTDV